MTGHVLDLYKQEGLNAGMDLVIAKPMHVSDLKYIFSKFNIQIFSDSWKSINYMWIITPTLLYYKQKIKFFNFFYHNKKHNYFQHQK